MHDGGRAGAEFSGIRRRHGSSRRQNSRLTPEGRFPAERGGGTLLARVWTGESVPERKSRAPLFRDFAAIYRERRRSRWKPSSLKTHDIYMRNRLMPTFGRLRLDAIDHARVSAWFDAASADRPGAANRAFEILRAMLAAARRWGELGEHVPDACANIAKNPRRPVARFLGREELQHLGTVLDRYAADRPRPVAAIRLLTLTGARLSEVLNLRWDEIGELSQDGASARLEDSKTGPRTLWFGPEAVAVLAALPRRDGEARVFPDDLTAARLYTFWVGVREEAGLRGVRIHDARHTYASQGVMNGVGLTAVGKLLGHRKRATTAIYVHLDDAALRDAAAQAATVIARAMGYKAASQPLPAEIGDDETPAARPGIARPTKRVAPPDWRTPSGRRGGDEGPGETPQKHDPGNKPRSYFY